MLCVVPTSVGRLWDTAFYHKATPEIIPEEAAIVQLIFDKYVNEKMSLFALTKYLNAQGYKTSRGKPFEKRSWSTLSKIPAMQEISAGTGP